MVHGLRHVLSLFFMHTRTRNRATDDRFLLGDEADDPKNDTPEKACSVRRRK